MRQVVARMSCVLCMDSSVIFGFGAKNQAPAGGAKAGGCGWVRISRVLNMDSSVNFGFGAKIENFAQLLSLSHSSALQHVNLSDLREYIKTSLQLNYVDQSF